MMTSYPHKACVHYIHVVLFKPFPFTHLASFCVVATCAILRARWLATAMLLRATCMDGAVGRVRSTANT
jgi:hypothetical protein